MKRLLSLAPIALVSMSAHAGHGMFSLQYSALSYTDEGSGQELNPDAVVVRAGHQPTEHVGIEGRLGIGLRDETVGVAEVGLSHLLGVYGQARAPFGPVTPYFVAGLTRAQAEFSDPGGSMTETESGFSFGAGVDIAPDDLGLNLEYMQYLDETGYEFEALSAGLVVIW